MNHQKMILIQTLQDAEEGSEYADHIGYSFPKVQKKFAELIKDRTGEEWEVLSFCGDQGGKEFPSEDRILCFHRSFDRGTKSENIYIYQEVQDDPYFLLMDFNFRQTTTGTEARGYK